MATRTSLRHFRRMRKATSAGTANGTWTLGIWTKLKGTASEHLVVAGAGVGVAVADLQVLQRQRVLVARFLP